jgi:hypothetical protein
VRAGMDPRLMEQALWIAALCCQGNPAAQHQILDSGHLPHIIALLHAGEFPRLLHSIRPTSSPCFTPVSFHACFMLANLFFLSYFIALLHASDFPRLLHSYCPT